MDYKEEIRLKLMAARAIEILHERGRVSDTANDVAERLVKSAFRLWKKHNGSSNITEFALWLEVQ